MPSRQKNHIYRIPLPYTALKIYVALPTDNEPDWMKEPSLEDTSDTEKFLITSGNDWDRMEEFIIDEESEEERALFTLYSIFKLISCINNKVL